MNQLEKKLSGIIKQSFITDIKKARITASSVLDG